MVFILNKFNIILRKYPFYIQSLNKYVNYILPSTATCDPCAWAGEKTCRLSSLQKRCTGMHLAHVLKESFQGFFSDVCFGWKDFVLTHLQRTWLADKAASHTPHTACSLGRILPMGWTEIRSPLWLLPEPGHPWLRWNWHRPTQRHPIFCWSHSNPWQICFVITNVN